MRPASSSPNADLIGEKYSGVRPAPGYPACPDHLVKKPMFDVLQCHDIHMTVTESLAMLPAASVSGFYLAHPDSTYFSVGKISQDQLEDYTRRSGLAPEGRAPRARAAALALVAQAARHEGLALVALLAGCLLVAVSHALLLGHRLGRGARQARTHERLALIPFLAGACLLHAVILSVWLLARHGSAKLTASVAAIAAMALRIVPSGGKKSLPHRA